MERGSMNGLKRWTIVLALGLVYLATPGCDWLDDDNWGEVGMVVDTTLGCWAIVTGELGSEEAEFYEPVNLDGRFEVDRLLVRFEYVELEEWVSTCMVGPQIELTRIEEL
jgi:hypothetical protein